LTTTVQTRVHYQTNYVVSVIIEPSGVSLGKK